MKHDNSHSLYLSAIVSFLAVGIPYWLISYSEVNLLSALLTPFLILVVLSALLVRMYTNLSFWRITSVIGLSVVAAIIIRVLFEVAQDSTSHNLWPFEVMIALIVGFTSAAVGTLLGSLIAGYLPNRTNDLNL